MAKSNYFKKFINSNDNFIHIFGNGLNEYLINTQGIVIDLSGNIIPQVLDDELELSVNIRVKMFGNLLIHYKVSHLVQHTFKPTKLPLENYCDVKVLYVDGDKTNLHPENLLWSWTG